MSTIDAHSYYSMAYAKNLIFENQIITYIQICDIVRFRTGVSSLERDICELKQEM